MFISTGIDNLELRLTITQGEAGALRTLCHYKSEHNRSYVLLGGYKAPSIFLHFVPGKVFANLNIPKIAFGHNVRLAGPGQVRQAIRVLTQNTKRVAPRLNWKRAEVSRLHLTFTSEVPDFEACTHLCNAPHGYRKYNGFENSNGYINSNTKNLHVNYYEKTSHLHSEGMQVPKDVLLEMDSLDHLLFRFETRLNQSVLSELKKHGEWNGLYILAKDLFGPGFVSAMTYLRWRFERHVPIPVDRTPKLRGGMSDREYAMLNTRRIANANSAQMRERALADHKTDLISNGLLQKELTRITTLEQRNLVISLHELLESEVKQICKTVVVVNGNIKTQEFEHASRTLRHSHTISSNTYSKRPEAA